MNFTMGRSVVTEHKQVYHATPRGQAAALSLLSLTSGSGVVRMIHAQLKTKTQAGVLPLRNSTQATRCPWAR